MNDLVNLIEQMAQQTGKDVKRIMSDLLYFIICNFNPEPTADPTWTYTKEQNAMFHKMMCQWLTLMGMELNHKEWYDPWGDLFMWFTPKGGTKGQFFTPPEICNLMAEVTNPADAEPTTVCGAFGKRVTVNDPACGSGRNLLAAHAEFIRAKARPPYLVAEDIDIDCCQMTAVNMMSHGCFGEVICHNSLTDPKGVRVGFIINEGLYPLQPGFPTIRVKMEPEWFVSLR